MPIVIPIEVGDTVYVGKFKNKRITVREIGQDEHGQPLVNGKNILKIRIANLDYKADQIEGVDMSLLQKMYEGKASDKLKTKKGPYTEEAIRKIYDDDADVKISAKHPSHKKEEWWAQVINVRSTGADFQFLLFFDDPKETKAVFKLVKGIPEFVKLV